MRFRPGATGQFLTNAFIVFDASPKTFLSVPVAKFSPLALGSALLRKPMKSTKRDITPFFVSRS